MPTEPTPIEKLLTAIGEVAESLSDLCNPHCDMLAAKLRAAIAAAEAAPVPTLTPEAIYDQCFPLPNDPPRDFAGLHETRRTKWAAFAARLAAITAPKAEALLRWEGDDLMLGKMHVGRVFRSTMDNCEDEWCGEVNGAPITLLGDTTEQAARDAVWRRAAELLLGGGS